MMQASLASPQAAMRVAALQLLCTGASPDLPRTDREDGPMLPGPPRLPGEEPDSGTARFRDFRGQGLPGVQGCKDACTLVPWYPRVQGTSLLLRIWVHRIFPAVRTELWCLLLTSCGVPVDLWPPRVPGPFHRPVHGCMHVGLQQWARAVITRFAEAPSRPCA